MKLLNTAKGGIDLSSILMVCLLVVVSFMILYPLGMVFYGSVWDSSPGSPGNFSFKGYEEVYAKIDTYKVLWTTFWLAFVRTFFALTIAILIAWVVARTNVPYKQFLELVLLFAFFMPLLPRVIAWVLMLSPRTGFANVILRNVIPFDIPTLNCFSYGGIIWVGVLVWVPILYIFITPAFMAMDANLEDSARMCGAGLWTTVARIDLPLLAPALLATAALGFVRMMESFEVEALLGMRAGIYVFSTRIYGYVAHSEPPEYPPGMALAVTLLVITFGIVALQWKLLGHRQYTTVTGRGDQARPIDLGRWRWVGFGAVLLFVIISTFLPLAILVWGSLMKVTGVFMADMYTLAHYRRAFSDPLLWTAIRNTLLMAFSTATIGMVLCTFVSYVVIKTNFSARKLLDFIVWIPWAIPSIVMALGFMWAYIFLPLPFRIYGTLYLLILVLITKGFPLGTRTMTSTIIQISDELEQVARVHGASWIESFAYILLPLLSRGFLAGWILLFAFAVKDLSTVILLYSTESTVISTQIFDWWKGGALEEAIVLGLLEAVLIGICFVAAQLIRRRFGSWTSM